VVTTLAKTLWKNQHLPWLNTPKSLRTVVGKGVKLQGNFVCQANAPLINPAKQKSQLKPNPTRFQPRVKVCLIDENSRKIIKWAMSCIL